jgi:hypothetical protein
MPHPELKPFPSFEPPQPPKSLQHSSCSDIGASSSEILCPADLQGRVTEVERWLAQETRQELNIGNVSLEDLEELDLNLSQKGIKIR